MASYPLTLEWLYSQLPVYQHTGGGKTYKIDLSKTHAFVRALGHPEAGLPTVHIGGTNGKGSTAHMTASCLQEGGYRVGLYTSPHLLDFRERIKVNGEPCPKAFVTAFVEAWKPLMRELQLSFFEMTVGLALCYFKEVKVDVAVIEVGMGGRLDSTNVIEPLVTAITNVDLDHQAFLGDTRAQIAKEKAGIFKKGVRAIIGERHPETTDVFKGTAHQIGAPLTFAEDLPLLTSPMDLKGRYQYKNQRLARAILQELHAFPLSASQIDAGFSRVVYNTGLQGRWQVVSTQPFTVLDTAHNPHGLKEAITQFIEMGDALMHIVFGMVSDKDVAPILSCLPTNATYYFCTPSIPRGLPTEALMAFTRNAGLEGEAYPSVREAWQAAQRKAKNGERIYIGGSTFVVADALKVKNEGLLQS